MIKLIFSDMDGTLLDDDGNLPDGFDDIIRQLHERGAMFAPASGRQYHALLRHFGKYEKDFVFVAENGTYIIDRGKEIFSATIPKSDAMKLVAESRNVDGAYPVVCGKNYAYVTERNDAFFAEMERYYTRYKLVDSFDEIDEGIIKVAVCDVRYADAEHTLYPKFLKYQDPGTLRVVLSSNYWIDVMDAKSNKGTAVKLVQERLHVSPEECAAFGDYLNDLEMMGAVGYSFAMQNALPDVKRAARFTARSNADNGVIEKLQELLDKQLI